MNLTPAEMTVYRETARRRQEQSQAERTRLQSQAWEDARRAASLLREQYGAARVVVFGSLIHPGCFTRWSDIDLAAWGISPEDTLRALGAVMDLDKPSEINLVDMNSTRPSLRKIIEEEGVDI